MTIGKTPARGEQNYWINGKYNWVSISDMVDGGTISTTKEKVSDLAVKEIFSAPISEKGSLLMSFKLSIGKTSILDIDAYHNEAIITIRPVIDKEYATVARATTYNRTNKSVIEATAMIVQSSELFVSALAVVEYQ